MSNAMIEKLESYLKEDPNDSFTKFALALEYKKIDDLTHAIHLLEEIHADDPDYIGIYYHLGRLYEVTNEIGKAISSYEEGIDKAKNTNDSQTLSELKSALMELKTIDE